MPRLGIGLGVGDVRPSTTSSEALALAAAMTVQPTASRLTAINNLIVALKSCGAWAKLDRLYVTAAADSQAASLDWIHPGTDSLALSGSAEFLADRGYRDTGAGTGQVKNATNFSSLTLFTQNNASFGIWAQGARSGSGVCAGEDSAFKVGVAPLGEYGQLNSAFTSVAMPIPAGYTGKLNWKGFFMLTRSDATNVTAYMNTLSGVTAAASATRPAAPLKVCLGADQVVSMAFAGADLATENASNAVYNAFQAYMYAVGADNAFTGEWSFDYTTTPSIKSPEGFIWETYFPSQTLFDWEGVPRATQEYEVPFVGYRRVRNLFTDTDPRLTAAVANQTVALTISHDYVLSFTGTGSITFGGSLGVSNTTLNGQGASTRVAKAKFTPTSSGNLTFTISGDVRFAQLEDVSYQSNQNPGEYVSVGSLPYPFHGCARDGIKYFTTQNGNTVASEVVTAAAGSSLTTIKGLYHFCGDLNRCLFSEDTGNAGWTKTATAPTITSASDNCGEIVLDTVSDGSGAALCGIEQSIAWDTTADGADGSCKGVSLIVKQGTSTSSLVWVRDTTNSADRLVATITWSAGVPVLAVTTGFVDTNTDGTHGNGAEQLANSCWRVSFTTASSIVIDGSATNRLGFYPAATGTGDTASTGNIKVGGFQAANHPRVGPYQKTTSAAQTRYAPVIQDVRYGGLSWFNNTEGTYFEEYKLERKGITTTIPMEYYLYEVAKRNQHPNDRMMVTGNESLALDDLIYSGGVNQTDASNTPGVALNTVEKVALGYKANDCSYSFNGSTVKQYNSVTLPMATYTPDSFAVSSGIDVYSYARHINFADLKGYIRKQSYYQTRKTNTQLNALTA